MSNFSNLERFLENKDILEDSRTGCISLNNRHTRPSVSFRGVSTPVYRVIHQYVSGEPLDRSEVVRHKCDNGLCFNPEHLEIGSIADNNRDRMNFN